MIKIKWGKLVTNSFYPAFVSNSVIGKIFGIDGSSVRWLYMKRFKELENPKVTTRRQAANR